MSGSVTAWTSGGAALRDQQEAFWERAMSGFEELMEEDG